MVIIGKKDATGHSRTTNPQVGIQGPLNLGILPWTLKVVPLGFGAPF